MHRPVRRRRGLCKTTDFLPSAALCLPDPSRKDLLDAPFARRFCCRTSRRFARSRPILARRGQDKGKSVEELHKEDADRSRPRAAMADAPVEERTVATRHSVAVNGRTLPYTATAGTLTIRDDEGKPTASIFYTAYTLDGGAEPRRPVMFFYNGGPGSASLWLRMGSFGPMRMQTGNAGIYPPGAVQLRPQSRHPARRDRHGVHRRAGHRLFASARRRQAGRFLRRRPGRRRLRPRNHALRDQVRPLGQPQVPVRRELWHDPLGRAGLSAAGARNGAERRRSCCRRS